MGTTAEDMQKLFGKAICFVFPDVGWSVANFVTEAQFLHKLGFDTMSPKIGEAEQPWYSVQAVKDQRQACLDNGIGYAPFWYCDGPKFNIVPGECALLREYGDANAGIMIADMETEWNYQVGAARQFESEMRPWSGVLGVTTWADPAYQGWLGVIAAIAPAVNVWIPQRYNNWLANQSMPPEVTIVQPAVDMSLEFGANNVTSIVASIARAGGSAWIWDNVYAAGNQPLARNLCAILHKG